MIPDFFCLHCHKCCGPIIWFKPEEILIRDYLLKNKLEYRLLSTDEFENFNMKCPYLIEDRCVIYPVRPIVCRLQGVISDLPCEFNKNNLLSDRQLNIIKKEFQNLLRITNGTGFFFSTRRIKNL